MPSFAARAPRCTIANVDTGESMACLFNPAQLTEKVSTIWNHLAVPGLSHPVLQYQSTGSRQLSGVEFFIDRLFASRSGNEAYVGEFSALLRALTVPREGSQDVATVSPPGALFIWPKLLTIECVVGSVEFSYRQFGADGSVLVHVATVNFEEIVDARAAREDT